jgi:pimeloyl-ACP methyl ester carboxylesterase
MFERDKARMLAFKDISDEQIKSIQVPVLVVNGDTDVIRTEHALELSRMLPHAQLAILPGGHGDYLGEICAPNKTSNMPVFFVALINDFLGK